MCLIVFVCTWFGISGFLATKGILVILKANGILVIWWVRVN